MEFGEQLVSRFNQLVSSLGDVMPGVLTCVTLGLAASFLSENYGGPVMLYALLFGMAFNFLAEEGKCVAGVELTSNVILRVGVALLGVRITIDQVTGLGIVPVVMVVFAVTSTILLAGVLHACWALVVTRVCFPAVRSPSAGLLLPWPCRLYYPKMRKVKEEPS